MSKNGFHQILRVDHAGELGAKWIYEGQLRWVRDADAKSKIQHMYEQEIVHLSYFEEMMKKHHVRPTAVMPLWKWVGKTAGAVSAMLGPKAAMACTEAVEEVIDEHYSKQIDALKHVAPYETELIETLEVFREDECNHRDLAASYETHPTFIKQMIKNAIKSGVRIAIAVSKRI